MLRKTVTRSFLILTCTAAFTFVFAQFPWETESSESESASSESSFDSESSFGSQSSFGSFSEPEPEPEPEPEAVEAPAKTRAEKPERPARAPRARSSEISSEQLTCPVCVSKKLKQNIFVDSDGKRIYLCSIACKGRVSRNPQAFIDKLEKRGEKVGSN